MNYLESADRQFRYYKNLADSCIAQLDEQDLFFQYNTESNSIAILMQHIAGNMLSRFTDFLTSDGEKAWRNRDEEFASQFSERDALLAYWEKGWNCLFETLGMLSEADLSKIVYIRNEGHTITEALNRQLCHYPYHIGQIIFIGKMLRNDQWQSLSIPRGGSVTYNREKFNAEKGIRHFTEGETGKS